VRTPSGKPVVLSGLVKEDVNTIVRKIPLLGDIPLLGRLFRDQSDIKEKTEIVIYIVPYLSRDSEAEDQEPSMKFERYYHSLIAGRGQ
jgi:type II secretory pathway component GspD/PulD (secretin)